MAQENKKGVVRCCCYFRNGEPHCPLATNEKDLDSLHLFNSFIEPVGYVDIDKAFVCHGTRKDTCKHCPFN